MPAARDARGLAQTATRQLLEELTEEEKEHLVAVVDPPRAGLHPHCKITVALGPSAQGRH